MLHDAGAALGAKHAAIDRMVAVALDVADLAAGDMHVDPAAAGAHVAGRLADFVRHAWRGVDAIAFGGRAAVGERPLRWRRIRARGLAAAHEVLLAVLPLLPPAGRDFGPAPRM